MDENKKRKIVYLDRNKIARDEFIARHENSRVAIKAMSTVHEVKDWVSVNGNPDLVIIDLYREKDGDKFQSNVEELEKKLQLFGIRRRELLKELEALYEETDFDDFDDLVKYYPDGEFPIAIGSRYGRRLCSSKKSSIFQSKGGYWIWKKGDRPGKNSNCDELFVEQEEDSILRLIDSFEINYGKYSSLSKKLNISTDEIEEKETQINNLNEVLKQIKSENKKLVSDKRTLASFCLFLLASMTFMLAIYLINLAEGTSIEKLSVISSIVTIISFVIAFISARKIWPSKFKFLTSNSDLTKQSR